MNIKRSWRLYSFPGLLVLPVFMLAATWLAEAQSPLPDDFNPGAGGSVLAMAVQADGKILVGGGFTGLGGQTRYRIGRLNSDGTLETGFNPQADATVYSLAVQADGKILVGGDFTLLAGQSRHAIGRLNTNGSLDAGFNTRLFDPRPPDYTYTARAQAIVVQPDGKIVFGGRYQKIPTPGIPGPVVSYIYRVNTNGTTDTNFLTSASAATWVASLALQPDGKILAGGSFLTLRGQTRHHIGRLNSDGSLDTAFDPGADGNVLALAVQADGKILVGGSFEMLAGQARTNIARLNPEGTLDDNFAPVATGGTSPAVYSIAVQTDGKILVSGLFTTIAGQPRANLARLNADGTLDVGFNPGANNYVYGLALQADGKILAGGQFSQLGGQSRTCIGRLNNTEPATQSLDYDGSTFTWLRGGSSPEVLRTTLEVSTNLTNWSFLTDGAQIPGGWQFSAQSLPPDSRVRVRGYASGGAYNASSWFVETISGPCYFLSQPVGRTNNAGTSASFSAAAAGSPPLSYQWLKNGTPVQDGGQVSGVQTMTLRLGNVYGADAGGYSMIASNAFGSITSIVATLRVIDPLITSSPAASSNIVGTSATFSVNAQGTATLGYQWRKDTVNLEDAGNVSGAHTPTLTLTNVTGADAGYYSVRVTNAFGSATSMSARLTVVDPFIGSQPTSKSVAQGQIAALEVTAIGTEPLNYQWRKNGVSVAGETNATLFVTNLQCMDGGGYDVIISNGFGSVTSAVAFLTVDANQATADVWNPGAGNSVYSMAALTDGRVLVGGGFSSLGGEPRNYIGLVNSDGTLATNFNPNANAKVCSMLLQNDGKVIIGGYFSTVSGQTRNGIARLNGDGSLDLGFDPGTSSSVYSPPRVLCMALQADGKILVGGVFDRLGGQTRQNIGRLNTDGTVDNAFNPGAWWTHSLIVQRDGRILVGGPTDLVRLNSDGTRDTNFVGSFSGGLLNTLALQADGKILLGGAFSNLSGQARRNIGRLNPDGTLDAGFNPSSSDLVAALALQCDGKILVSGYFTNLCGQTRSYLGRLNADGTLDCTFSPGVGGGSLPVVYSLMIQSDGGILLGGYFGSIGGQPRSYIGRLNNTETATAQLSFGGSTLTWLRDKTSPEVCWTTFEASTNGTDWGLLGSGTRVSRGWVLGGVSLPARATVRVRGYFQSSGHDSTGGGSSSWFAESTITVGPNLPPNILTSDGSFGFRTNQFGFNLRAASGQAVVVEASTNLVTWIPIHTNLMGSTGLFLFRDPESGLFPRRFYRARLYAGALPAPSICSGDGLGFENGRFGFDISGVAGQTVLVETSTNLQNWQPLQTNTLDAGLIYFSDSGSTNAPCRFYRARLAP